MKERMKKDITKVHTCTAQRYDHSWAYEKHSITVHGLGIKDYARNTLGRSKTQYNYISLVVPYFLRQIHRKLNTMMSNRGKRSQDKDKQKD